MANLKSDLAAVTRTLKQLTKKTEQLAKQVDKLSKPKAAKKPKAKKAVKVKAKRRVVAKKRVAPKKKVARKKKVVRKKKVAAKKRVAARRAPKQSALIEVARVRKYLDPRLTNIFVDSCAFDPKYSPEDEASMELFRLSEAEKIGLIVAHSIQKEIDHPNTPAWVKRVAESKISTVEVNLSDNERKIKKAILGILAGAGNPETMRQDADHIYEASKYGSYFVTADERILKREEELFELCTVTVLKPSAVLEIYKQYEGA